MRFLFGDHLSRSPSSRRCSTCLSLLLQDRERVVSKDDLLASVWSGRIVSNATLDSRIAAARRVVGDSGGAQTLIRTFARKGVRFVGEVREEESRRACAGNGGNSKLLCRTAGEGDQAQIAWWVRVIAGGSRRIREE